MARLIVASAESPEINLWLAYSHQETKTKTERETEKNPFHPYGSHNLNSFRKCALIYIVSHPN